MISLGYYNGQFGPVEELRVPLLDRAMFFGDGCYEAAMIMHGRALDLDDHIARFWSSMGFMCIRPDFSQEQLKSILRDCIARCEGDTKMIYWQVSRGTAPRSHCFPPEDTKPNLLVTVNQKGMPDCFTPMALITREDTRYFHCNVKTLNLFPNVMANQAAKEAGAFEAIFIRPDGFVTEGSHTNVHILKDGVLHTHEDGNLILPGIAKKQMLACARSLGIPVVEKAFTREALFDADEIFVTGSSTFLKRARQLDGRPAGGHDTPLYEKLARAYIDRAERVTAG